MKSSLQKLKATNQPYKILEVEKTQRPEASSAESRDAVASLQYHTGFRLLLQKLAYQKSVLRSVLETSKHQRLEDVYLVQSGINWIKWIEEFIARETAAPRQTPLDVNAEEEALLNKFRASIESVGA